jgi:hypothetical protein
MMRKMAMMLAAAAIVAAGVASPAAARGGGHGGGFHGGVGHSFAAPPIGSRQFTGRVDHDHDRGRHFRHGRFFVYGDDGYYDNCYARVWTRWGWRWQYVCY